MMVFAWAAWFGIALIIQGVYIFRRGVVVPFFLTPPVQPPIPIWKRLRTGAIYVGSGFGLLAITTNEVFHRYELRKSAIAPSALLVVLGILFFTRPALAVRWAQDTHPSLSPKKTSTIAIARVVGAALLFFGLLFLTIDRG
jgi:hypothetical protein